MPNQSNAKKSSRGPIWTREETMMAFNLYSKMPFGQIHDYHPDIVELAKALNRPPASVSMKMCNLATLDPQHAGRIKGLRVARVEKEVWAEFHADPGQFMLESEELLSRRIGKPPADFRLDPDITDLPKGETRRRLVNMRRNQFVFRKMILSAYNGRCCVTGLAVPDLLNASHIVPWSANPNERINPRNGLCLNTLHDRAFDRGFITVSPDLIVCVSRKLHVKADESVGARFLLVSEGKQIDRPVRFPPDRKFLDYHYREIFQR